MLLWGLLTATWLKKFLFLLTGKRRTPSGLTKCRFATKTVGWKHILIILTDISLVKGLKQRSWFNCNILQVIVDMDSITSGGLFHSLLVLVYL